MTLYLYFGRRYLQAFLRVFVIVAVLIFLIQVLENIRGLAKYGVDFSQSLILASTGTPSFILQSLPIIVMLAALTFCVGLARSNEFVVSRSVGVSALRALALPAFYTLALGFLAITMLNPLAAAFQTQNQKLKAEYLNQPLRAVSIGEDGFWLRQKDELGHTVINARTTNRNGTSLRDATALRFNEQGEIAERLFSRRAILSNGDWIFTNGKRWDLTRGTLNPEEDATSFDLLRFPTDITPEQILEGYPQPDSVAIWDLPQLIRTIREAGISAVPHVIHFHNELAQPLMLVAMTIIGAAFTLQNARLGNLGISVFLAIVCGFSLYFLQNLAMTLGEAGEIPVLVAAWAPPMSAIFLAVGLFLLFEDG